MRLPPRAPAEQLLSAGATKELGHKLAVAFLETTDIHYVTILKKMHAFYYMCRNSGDHRVSENRYECIMHQTHFFSLSAIVVQIVQKI